MDVYFIMVPLSNRSKTKYSSVVLQNPEQDFRHHAVASPCQYMHAICHIFEQRQDMA